MEIELEYELPIRVTGDVSPGTSSYFCGNFGNWLPGDPAEVTNLKVFVGDKEITDQLSESDKEYFENQLIEEKSEEAA